MALSYETQPEEARRQAWDTYHQMGIDLLFACDLDDVDYPTALRHVIAERDALLLEVGRPRQPLELLCSVTDS